MTGGTLRHCGPHTPGTTPDPPAQAGPDPARRTRCRLDSITSTTLDTALEDRPEEGVVRANRRIFTDEEIFDPAAVSGTGEPGSPGAGAEELVVVDTCSATTPTDGDGTRSATTPTDGDGTRSDTTPTDGTWTAAPTTTPGSTQVSRLPGDPVAAIEARPDGYSPPAPGLFPDPVPTTEPPAPIGARPAGYRLPPVAVPPVSLPVRSPAGTPMPRSETITAAPGVVTGEVHAALSHSDAQFDARMALELGAVELTMGRLDGARLAEFRMLADSANLHIDGDRFLDPAAFTEANSRFHEFLFRCTGNEALLQAYRMLEVTRVMNSILPDARWVSEDIVREHRELIAVFDAGDRDAARYLIRRHADHAKATMRTALDRREAVAS